MGAFDLFAEDRLFNFWIIDGFCRGNNERFMIGMRQKELSAVTLTGLTNVGSIVGHRIINVVAFRWLVFDSVFVRC